MELKCLKCSSKKIIKNGIVFGLQRYKCKGCGYQFTKTAPHGKPMHTHLISHGLYEAGFSMRSIARIVGVTAQSVSRWIKKWHIVYKYETRGSEIISDINRHNIFNQLNIKEDEAYFAISDTLPSGAKVHIMIQNTDNKKITL